VPALVAAGRTSTPVDEILNAFQEECGSDQAALGVA
jgi:hypothetical protein